MTFGFSRDDAGKLDVYKRQGNPRFAYDSYRRFIQRYSDVVMEVPKSYFEKIIDEMKEAKGVHYDTCLCLLYTSRCV